MILSFKTHINNKPTGFVQKILDNIKIHTIRKSNRYTGKQLHMATGVRTKHYNQFNKNIPHLQIGISDQVIKILRCDELPHKMRMADDVCQINVNIDGLVYPTCFKIKIDTRYINTTEMKQLAANDGFNSLNDFFNWFNQDYEGFIIHWTNLKY